MDSVQRAAATTTLNSNDQSIIKQHIQQELNREKAFMPGDQTTTGVKTDNVAMDTSKVTDKPILQHQKEVIPSQVATSGTSYGGGEAGVGHTLSNVAQPHHQRENAMDLTHDKTHDKSKHHLFGHHHEKDKVGEQEKFPITDDLKHSTKAERNLNITEIRSETDLFTLLWDSHRPNDHDELKSHALRDVMHDMGIIDTSAAVEDLMKFNTTGSSGSQRVNMLAFMNWWKLSGNKFLLGRHSHGSWWLMNQLRHYFAQPGQFKHQFPVTQETLAASLASIQCGTSHGPDLSNLSSGVVPNDCVGDRPNVGVMAPSLIEARDRVARWWKHSSWENEKSYSVFDLMRLMTKDRKSLYTLWPDLGRMTAADIGKHPHGYDANTNVNLKY